MSIPLAWPVMFCGLLVAVGFIIWATNRRLPRIGGGILDSCRLTFSAPAFLVPTAMVGTGLIVLLATSSTTRGGQNPWMVNDQWVVLHCVSILIVAVGVAGHIGLLEAHREGRVASADDFLRGIRSHTVTFVAAKFAWAGLICIPRDHAWRIGDPGRLLTFGDGSSIPFYVAVLAPSFLLAGVLTTATHHPGRPLRAIATGVMFSLRNPVAVGKLVLLQFGLAALCIGILGGYETTLFTVFNGSPIGFQLYAYVPPAFGVDPNELFVTALMAATAPVMLTAYWTMANLAPRSAPVASGIPDGGNVKRSAVP